MTGTAYITRGRILRWRERLNKKLPRMVDWFDPMLLGMVGVRTMISTTIGQYADQRPVQAMMDGEADKVKLALRHDYSGIGQNNTLSSGAVTGHVAKSLPVDADGALWVDFNADLGDGFEATYAVAHLMAEPALKVVGADTPGEVLPGAELIILGGDLAYPNATVKEYQDRCLDPFNATLPAEQFDANTKGVQPPEKKLFFFAGNHDWYDGLAAFTSVFCKTSEEGKGIKLGKWRGEQRRSYFALKLPHDWWILALDTGLNDSIDEAQERYFRDVISQTTASDKIIVMTHAPGWVDRLDNCVNIVSDIVRHRADAIAKTGQSGAEPSGPSIRAYVAGDLHHYSRYVSAHGVAPKSGAPARDEAAIHLITSGGGGAFLHPTHQLKRTLPVSFTGPLQRASGNVVERNYPISARSVYPARLTSRLLTFKNLLLPFRNWRFAILLGLIYFLYAWVYQVGSASNPLPTRYADIVGQQATAAKQSAIAAASRDRPILQRFADLAGRQVFAPDLQTAASKAKAGGEAATGAVAKARETIDAIAAWSEWTDVNKRYQALREKGDKATPVGASRSIPPEESALQQQAVALRDKFSKLFPNTINFGNGVPGAMRERLEQDVAASYQANERAIVSDHELVGAYQSAAPRLVGVEAIELSAAAQEARAAVDRMQAATEQAKLVAEQHKVLLEQRSNLTKDRGTWGNLLDRALDNPAFFFMLLALWFGLFNYVDASLLTGRWTTWLRLPTKLFFGTLHFAYHIIALVSVFALARYVRTAADVLVGGGAALFSALRSGQQKPDDLTNSFKQASSYIGECYNSDHLYTEGAKFSEWWLTFGSCLEADGGVGIQLAGVLSLALTTITFGGFLGGLIFGIYWVSTTAVFGMHMDAFSALGMRDYKNFLRMRFEKSGDLTIYAIGLKRVPGPKGWRAPASPDEPQVVPKKRLRPHLIEKVVIRGRDASAGAKST